MVGGRIAPPAAGCSAPGAGGHSVSFRRVAWWSRRPPAPRIGRLRRDAPASPTPASL